MEYAGQNVALSSLSPTVSAAAALMLRRGDTWVRGGRRRSWCRMAAGSGAEAAALSAFLWLRSIRAGQKELEGSGNRGEKGAGRASRAAALAGPDEPARAWVDVPRLVEADDGDLSSAPALASFSSSRRANGVPADVNAPAPAPSAYVSFAAVASGRASALAPTRIMALLRTPLHLGQFSR